MDAELGMFKPLGPGRHGAVDRADRVQTTAFQSGFLGGRHWAFDMAGSLRFPFLEAILQEFLWLQNICPKGEGFDCWAVGCNWPQSSNGGLGLRPSWVSVIISKESR